MAAAGVAVRGGQELRMALQRVSIVDLVRLLVVALVATVMVPIGAEPADAAVPQGFAKAA